MAKLVIDCRLLVRDLLCLFDPVHAQKMVLKDKFWQACGDENVF
jgi:hypothetical protein